VSVAVIDTHEDFAVSVNRRCQILGHFLVMETSPPDFAQWIKSVGGTPKEASACFLYFVDWCSTHY
jgi:hypothetical protein